MLSAFFALMSTSLFAQSTGFTHQFDIPAQVADRALTKLAQQAGMPELLPFNEVRDVITNEVVGVYQVEEALELMFAGADLTGEVNEQCVLTVQLRQTREPEVE